jgi:hypothetical protein
MPSELEKLLGKLSAMALVSAKDHLLLVPVIVLKQENPNPVNTPQRRPKP